MKTFLTTTLAVALLASSSIVFAADNKGDNKSNNDTSVGGDRTGSINSKDRNLTAEEIEKCKTAPADDPGCVGVIRQ